MAVSQTSDYHQILGLPAFHRRSHLVTVKCQQNLEDAWVAIAQFLEQTSISRHRWVGFVYRTAVAESRASITMQSRDRALGISAVDFAAPGTGLALGISAVDFAAPGTGLALGISAVDFAATETGLTLGISAVDFAAPGTGLALGISAVDFAAPGTGLALGISAVDFAAPGTGFRERTWFKKVIFAALETSHLVYLHAFATECYHDWSALAYPMPFF